MKVSYLIKGLACVQLVTLVACEGDKEDNKPDPSSCTSLLAETVANGATLNGCYNVNENLRVDSGTLDIAKGSTFYFGTDFGLEIGEDAILKANGSAEEPVIFTSVNKARGAWKGIAVRSASQQSRLDHAIVEYAGGRAWTGNANSVGGIVTLEEARLSLKGGAIRDSKAAGLHVFDENAEISVDGTSFEKNLVPLWIPADSVAGLSNLSFSSNDESFIRVGREGSGKLDTGTWRKHALPYNITRTIHPQGTLTLEAGVELVFNQSIGITVSGEGRLSAIGTETAPIQMRGLEPTQGFWSGIYVYESRSSANVLDYVTLEDAGSDKWHGGEFSRAGVYLRDDGAGMTIRNSTFRRNAMAAVMADGEGALLSIENTLFESNERPLYLDPNLVGQLADDNTFAEEQPITLFGGTVATKQVWATFSVPYYATGHVLVEEELTLSPGTTFQFAQNKGLEVNEGILIANAQGSDPIIFTSRNEAIAGFWRGIYFYNSRSAANSLNNTEVTYAGSDKWTGAEQSQAGIYVRNSAVSLIATQVSYSGAFGISAEDDSSINPCDVGLSNNTKSDTRGSVADEACIL